MILKEQNSFASMQPKQCDISRQDSEALIASLMPSKIQHSNLNEEEDLDMSTINDRSRPLCIHG